jgi:hypothetical protein
MAAAAAANQYESRQNYTAASIASSRRAWMPMLPASETVPTTSVSPSASVPDFRFIQSFADTGPKSRMSYHWMTSGSDGKYGVIPRNNTESAFSSSTNHRPAFSSSTSRSVVLEGEESNPSVKTCTRCNTANTTTWRNDQEGQPLCDGCGLSDVSDFTLPRSLCERRRWSL